MNILKIKVNGDKVAILRKVERRKVDFFLQLCNPTTELIILGLQS